MRNNFRHVIKRQSSVDFPVTPPKKSVILVVEDDPDFLTTMRLLLKSRNFEVVTANGGVQALHWLEDHTPDAIILDIMMPDMNGFAVLRHVRADEQIGLLPVIMLSARTDQKARDESMEAGANAYFSKPAPMAELTEELRNQL